MTQTQLFHRPRQEECETQNSLSSSTENSVMQRKRPRYLPRCLCNKFAGLTTDGVFKPEKETARRDAARHLHLTACIVYRLEFSIHREVYGFSARKVKCHFKTRGAFTEFKILSMATAVAQTTRQRCPQEGRWPGDRAPPELRLSSTLIWHRLQALGPGRR